MKYFIQPVDPRVLHYIYVSIIDDNFTFQKLETSACIEKKVHSTRLDADELVNY